MLTFSVTFAQPWESCVDESDCDIDWTKGTKYIPVNDYDTCLVRVSYRFKKCDPPCSLIVVIDTIGIAHNSNCFQMLNERYYINTGFQDPDYPYLKRLWQDMQNKLFTLLINEQLSLCADTMPCPSIEKKTSIVSVQSACMKWCTAKTSFTAPPAWVTALGGTTATIQQISRCNELCCIIEVMYRRKANCEYEEVNREYSLRNQYGVVVGDPNSFKCDDELEYNCFWFNNIMYIQGYNSDCLTNCGLAD